jgi:uncharacterized protein (TIGR02453 family)
MNTQQLLDFLSQLQGNNNKDWMDLNRDRYKQVRADLMCLAETLLLKMRLIDSTLGLLRPADCVFRINRDIRFSKIKSPYKTSMGIYIAKGGKSMPYAGYYLHLEPCDKSFIAGGLYQPEGAILKGVRQEIDYNGEGLSTIVSNKAFKTSFGTLKGESLQRMPKGYDEAHPYKDWLKLKSLLAIQPLKDTEVTQPNLIERVLQGFQTLCPLIQFLNQGIQADTQ